MHSIVIIKIGDRSFLPKTAVIMDDPVKGRKDDDNNGSDDSAEFEVSEEEEEEQSVDNGLPQFDIKDMLLPPVRHPVESDYEERLRKHCDAFNLEIFNTDFKEGSPPYVPKIRSKVISSERIETIIDVLLHRKDRPKYYLDLYKSSMYDWVNTYQVDYRKNEDKHVLLRRPYMRGSQLKSPSKRMKVDYDKPIYCKIVCRPEEIFDAIDSCHREAAHKKVASTYNLACEYYYNITKDMVDRFVKLFQCVMQNPQEQRKRSVGQSILCTPFNIG